MSSAGEAYESDSEWEDSGADGEWSDGSSAASVDDDAADRERQSRDAAGQSAPECCSRACLSEKAQLFHASVASVNALSKSERVTAILSAINLSAQFAAENVTAEDTVDSVRERFSYFAPVFGRVCKEGFQKIFKISHRTFTLYRKRALTNAIHMKPHGNIGNTHASTVDVETVDDWLQEVSALQAEVAGVRVRRVVQDGDTVRLKARTENYALLPPSYTWDFLYGEFKRFMTEEFPGDLVCSRRTFLRIAASNHPKLRIRAPRDNVCDVCSILRSRMSKEVTVEESEAFARHVSEAKAMREQYQFDCVEMQSDDVVLTIDFSQNLTLPNVPETPSMWYFMTLVSVSMFGVYSHGSNKQYNFLYSERRAGKGSNEVISMLHRALQLEGVIKDTLPDKPCRLIVWADNCGGQNKNAFVVAYLRLLVDVGVVREAHLNFLIKGHTKNACDRGFGAVKRHVLRNEAWILADLVELVNTASTGGEAVCLEDDETVFGDVKPFLETLYKKLDGIQKYQMFTMHPEHRGIVECRVKSAPPHTAVDLKRRDANFAFLMCMPLKALWEKLFPPAPRPAVNAEKLSDFFKKISPYVPIQYQGHPFYKRPSDEIVNRAKVVKAQRATFRAERIQANAGERELERPVTKTAGKQRKRARPKSQVDDDEGKEGVV